MTTPRERGATRARAFERSIGRLIIATTYVAVGLLLAGVVLMAIGGISPLDRGPRLDLEALPADLVALAPSGFLWLGLLAVIATPVSRVVAAALVSARTGDRYLALVSVAILIVLAASVATGLAAG